MNCAATHAKTVNIARKLQLARPSATIRPDVLTVTPDMMCPSHLGKPCLQNSHCSRQCASCRFADPHSMGRPSPTTPLTPRSTGATPMGPPAPRQSILRNRGKAGGGGHTPGRTETPREGSRTTLLRRAEWRMEARARRVVRRGCTSTSRCGRMTVCLPGACSSLGFIVSGRAQCWFCLLHVRLFSHQCMRVPACYRVLTQKALVSTGVSGWRCHGLGGCARAIDGGVARVIAAWATRACIR